MKQNEEVRMADTNFFEIEGYLEDKVDIRKTKNDKEIAVFFIETTMGKSINDKKEALMLEKDWHRFTTCGRNVEELKSARRGDIVNVVGRNKPMLLTDSSGKTRHLNEFVVLKVDVYPNGKRA
jgi:hypothetical protein